MIGGVARVFEELFLDENDELRWMEIWKSPVVVDGGSVGIVGCARDITESKKMREELIAKERELSALADSSPGMMGSFYLRADGSMCMPYVSQNIWELFGLRPQDVADDATPLLALTHPDDLLRLGDSIAESAKTMTTWSEEYRILHPLLGERRMKGYTKPQPHPDGGVVWYSYVHDITDVRAAESLVDFLAYHDQLTGLPNRVLAKDRAEQMFAKARRAGKKAALLFADLDNFKTINDSMGHETGDKLLKLAADRLKSNLRESDTVTRCGGDEFLALLPELDDAENAANVAVKILSAFEAPFFVDDKIFSVTISIGISIFCDDGDDFDVLLKKADTALSEAKDTGKNIYYFFTRQMNEDVVKRLQVHNDLKSAVKNGELELYYQPQIDIANGSLVGAEALLRWNHPTMGLMLPLDFIPAAEAGGVIVEIGEWVVAEACAQAVKWQKEHKSQIVVAVNISAVQFKRGNLKETIVSALKESGLAPHCLELELTESILIKDTNTVLETVKELKSMGVKLSIDDFGTGYSSLSYLKRFAVDKLKIDRSFIQELGNNQESVAIVKAIIQMAKSLNLRTIAEGIETHDALESLMMHGCDEAQGFLFSKPIPASEFEAYLI